MRLAVAVIILAFFTAKTVAAQTCGRSPFDQASYTKINSHADLRQRVAADLLKYRNPNGVLSVMCFMQHYSALGDNQPFRTSSEIRYGTDGLHELLYYFDVLTWRRQPGTDVKTSVGYWVELASVDGALVVVDDDGRVIETVMAETTLDPRTCSPSQFEPNQFKGVRGGREIGRLIERSILAYLGADGEVDWLCFAEAFMEMNNHLPEKLWVRLIPEGPNQRGVYRFTIRNVNLLDYLFPAPGGSNGEFTAVVRAKNLKQIAIVERGGSYRWLEFE